MLKHARPYREELSNLMLEASLDPRYMYYFSQPGGFASDGDAADNTVWHHDFVSLNQDGDIVGAISYELDRYAGSAHNFGIISFDIGNLTFANDFRKVIIDLFEKYALNRISWFAFADNPVTPTYRRLCKKLGGRECGYERQCVRLLDGKLHDSVTFEVLASEYFESDFYRQRHCLKREATAQ